MSQFYSNIAYKQKIKTSHYTTIGGYRRKKSFFSKSFVISVFIHILFFAVLLVLPAPAFKKNVSVTLEQWQKEEPKPEIILPKLEPVMPSIPQAIPKTLPLKSAEKPPVASKPAESKPMVPSKPVTEGGVAATTPVIEAGYQAESSVFQGLDKDWGFLQEDQNDIATTGNAQLNLSGGARQFKAMPNFDFLESSNFVARVNSVKVELKIAADGTILSSQIVPPGSGEPALDREIRNVLKNSFLNDITLQGRETETVILTINFKDN